MLLQRFGGAYGIRDDGALESALQAAPHRAHYDEATLAVCAATYAYHLSQAHAFLDGNKRIAAAVAELFLELNNAHLEATDQELVHLILSIAAGAISRAAVEQQFEQWVQGNG